MAFTAWVVEGQPVVKVLPESMLSQVLNVMGNMSSEKMEYHYIKALFHEGFHAFQIERGTISDIIVFRQIMNLKQTIYIKQIIHLN